MPSRVLVLASEFPAIDPAVKETTRGWSLVGFQRSTIGGRIALEGVVCLNGAEALTWPVETRVR